MVGSLDAVSSLVAERILATGGDPIGVGRREPCGWPDEAEFQVRRDRSAVAAAVRQYRPSCLINFNNDPMRPAAGLALANAAMRAAASVRVPLLIHWGSVATYPRGSSDSRPWQETDELEDARGAGDQLAVDQAVREFASVHTRASAYVFRAATTVGPRNTAVIEDLSRTPLVSRSGRDQVMQFLHEEDAADVLWRAVQEGHGGTYNVAADGLVRLADVSRALGRPSAVLPASLAWALACIAWLLRRAPSPARQLRFAAGVPIVDNTRLKTHFGIRPQFTGREALAAARDRRRGANAPGAAPSPPPHADR